MVHGKCAVSSVSSVEHDAVMSISGVSHNEIVKEWSNIFSIPAVMYLAS